MKNNLLNKAIRVILGIVSILPQKKSGGAKSNTNTPTTEAPNTALPQADEHLKPEKIRKDSSTEDQQFSKTIPGIQAEAVKKEKSKEYIPKEATDKNPKDSAETEISPEEKQQETARETEKNDIGADSIEGKASTATAIPLSSLGLSVQLFNYLRASNITTVNILATKSSEELLKIKGINKFGVIEIIMALNKLDLDLRDSPSVDLKVNEPAPPKSEQEKKVIDTKTSNLAANPEIFEVIPKSSELDEQKAIQAIETIFEEYCLTQNEAKAFISSLQEIISENKRWSYAQRCLQYIQNSTQSFFKLYGRRYGPDQITKINIAIALITRKKVDALIKNPKNSHLMRAFL